MIHLREMPLVSFGEACFALASTDFSLKGQLLTIF